MKTIVAILVGLAFAASTVYAGCGKKAASVGKLEKFDADTKTITVTITDSSNADEVKNKKATLTLTPDSKVISGSKIEGVKVDELVGKNITVVSEHGKVDYLIALAGKS